MKIYLPETYEEFGALEGYGETEMNDEAAPTAKYFYERAAKLINSFEPFTKEEIDLLKMRECFDLKFFIDALFEWKHINEDTYKEVYQLLSEMCDNEYFDEIGFVFDNFLYYFEEQIE